MHKRSFVELPLELDVAPLAAELAALPEAAWQSTYWGQIHCSVATLLLRGGTAGGQLDYCGDEHTDAPALAALPGIAALLDGPLGTASYAFLFRMAPDGVALGHVDDAPVWRGLHRVHVPIVTHPDAVLVVADRVHHLEPGRAWTFDNQQLHGFANGPSARTHLILDLPPSPALNALLADATVHRGRDDPDAVARTRAWGERAVASYPGDAELRRQITTWRTCAWRDDAIAGRLNDSGVPAPEAGARWDAALVARLADG